MTDTPLLVGVDLGGTNVRAGLLTLQGELLDWKETPILAAQGPQAGVQRVGELIAALLAGFTSGPSSGETISGAPGIAAIGIGSTGPLDRKRGAIQNPYTLPGWEDVSIVEPLAQRFGAPVALENDADAAALGEAWLGAGRGLERMLMVTVGTGVGTGVILNGQIYRGLGDEHPEGGHLVVDPSGPRCYCGGHGCLESLVSGPAIAARAAAEPDLPRSALWALCGGPPSELSAAQIFNAARAADPLALRLVRETARYLGLGLVSLVMTFLPDAIVLTGGVMRSFDLLERDLRRTLQQHAVIVPADRVKLRLAELGQQAGLIGAARAAAGLISK